MAVVVVVKRKKTEKKGTAVAVACRAPRIMPA
jgi:hypothetical protein